MKKEVDLAMIINNQTYIDYLDRLKLLATSLFTWENLDDICGFGASRFLEKSLYELGRACFVNDTTKQKIGMKIFASILLIIIFLSIVFGLLLSLDVFLKTCWVTCSASS